VNAAIHSLLVDAHEGEPVGFLCEGHGVGHGGGEAGIIAVEGVGGVCGAERVHVHFDGSEVVETPCVPGDGGGEAELHGGLGGEVFDEAGFECFVDGTIFV